MASTQPFKVFKKFELSLLSYILKFSELHLKNIILVHFIVIFKYILKKQVGKTRNKCVKMGIAVVFGW